MGHRKNTAGKAGGALRLLLLALTPARVELGKNVTHPVWATNFTIIKMRGFEFTMLNEIIMFPFAPILLLCYKCIPEQ